MCKNLAIYFTLSFALILSACSDKKVQKEYYPNGNLKSKSYYKNGDLHGAKKLYYRNGSLERVSHYKNGVYHGSVKEYYRNGELKAIANFKEDSQHGITKHYYKSGILEQKGDYINGRQEGEFIFYYESGKLKMRALMEDDTATRFYQKFNKDGSFKEEYREIKVKPEYDTVTLGETHNFKVSSYGPVKHYKQIRAGVYMRN